MKDGFIKIAAVTPKIKVADPYYNVGQMELLARAAAKKGAKLIVFPELVISAYTCQDLFLNTDLQRACREALLQFADRTREVDALIFAGLPLKVSGKLYNTAAVLHRGRILAFIPKKHLPNYGEYYEARHFAPGSEEVTWAEFEGSRIPFGMNIIFREKTQVLPLRVAAELCEDLWTVNPPSTAHAMAGANVIVNLSASNEVVCKAGYRRDLVKNTSARLLAVYAYASAGEGESTQDLVFSGHNIIAENGSLLSESKLFDTGITMAVADIKKLEGERGRMTTYPSADIEGYTYIDFSLDMEETELNRYIARYPFVPSEDGARKERCEEILNIQALGLKKRLEHTGCKNVVIGLSGGLDSTLALLVTVRSFDMLGIDKKGIHCITMPCFGTTDRTYDNACSLARAVGATLREIPLQDAVRGHFRDIGHDESVQDVTYENCQARERTQVLMDIANQNNGLVIGTGDMSELALGWATYNGDHMSMYGVNVSVPKTLVRHLVKYYGESCGQKELSAVLTDVLDTPVSPELLPAQDGKISQKTEELVGPYELHDFYMYYLLRFGFSARKIFRMAVTAFEGVYDRAVILKWEKVFFRRFFAQHFKRSCLPDGAKVGSVAVSPRGDLRMPSDASSALWLQELESLENEQ